MTCPACSHPNRPGAKFCVECGAVLARACPACNAPCDADEKFCSECGAKVGAAPAPIAPDRRTSPLAEKIRQAKASIEGERKQVTVLFADVKGSMELAEQLDPEE